MTPLSILPADSFVGAAFAELLEDVTNLLAAAQQQKPVDRDEVKFWKGQQNALNRAQYHWAAGVRPQQAGDAWLLPSASRGGSLIHRLAKQGGIVVCSCEAGQRGLLCWHHMLINVIERAAELESAARNEERINGGGPDTTPEAAAALLAERLDATAQIVDAMRAAQQRPPIVHIGQRLADARRRLYAEAA